MHDSMPYDPIQDPGQGHAAFPIYPRLGQAANMLACIPSGLVYEVIKCSDKTSAVE